MNSVMHWLTQMKTAQEISTDLEALFITVAIVAPFAIVIGLYCASKKKERIETSVM